MGAAAAPASQPVRGLAQAGHSSRRRPFRIQPPTEQIERIRTSLIAAGGALILLRWIGHLELPTARIDDGGEVASMA